MAKRIRERIIPSCGNVFADMGLPDAEELDAEARRRAVMETAERHKRANGAAFLRILNRKNGEPPRPKDTRSHNLNRP
jgi:hypothetical protein